MTTTFLRPVTDPLAGLDEHGLVLLAGALVRALPADSTALLDVVDLGLERLAAQPLSGDVTDEALHDSVRRLARCESRAAAEKLRRIDEVTQRESFRRDAERSAADWVAAQTGTSARDARAQVRLAGALQRLPGLAARCATGDLTLGHAAAAARGLAALDRHAHQAEFDADDDAARAAVEADAEAAVAELDGFVTAQPGDVDPDRLDDKIKAWIITRRPAAEEDREVRSLRNRGLRWLPHRDADGCHTAIVKTNDTGRAQISAAIGALAARTSPRDTRDLRQRQHDALVTLCQQACDRGELPAVAAQRPHILLTGSRAARDGDPSADPMWLDGVGPVGSATAQLLSCDADTTDVVWDADRGVWVIGRANGDPSPAQRKIVMARDRSCVGCGAPASRCQIHHIRFRSKHGRTIVENLVLVCWSCHHGLHHLGWTITRAADGSFAISKRRAG